MIVDTSAVVAILFQEPDARRFAEHLAREEPLLISAATLVEIGIVALRHGGQRLLVDAMRIVEESAMQVAPVTAERAQSAIAAYGRFGRGVGCPACLTFGDCFAYALAKETNQPLLFKGADFSRTDVKAAT